MFLGLSLGAARRNRRQHSQCQSFMPGPRRPRWDGTPGTATAPASTRQDTLANADYMEKNLKSHGWNIITIDIQWYEPLAHTTEYRRGAVLEMDANGRLLPAGNRFPLTKELTLLQAGGGCPACQGPEVRPAPPARHPAAGGRSDNVPILGTTVHAADIADKTIRLPLERRHVRRGYVQARRAGILRFGFRADGLLGPGFREGRRPLGPLPQAEIEAIRKAIDKTRPAHRLLDLARRHARQPGRAHPDERQHVADQRRLLGQLGGPLRTVRDG